MTPVRLALAAAAIVCAGARAASAQDAQTVPFVDTEDATMSDIDVGQGDLHPILSFDVRNGDYARGAYDDDDANLDRVPVHVSIGGAAVLQRHRDGRASLFLIGQSSNGFHTPRAVERVRPRGWYESNTIVGLAWRPIEGVSTAVAYAIKASPNGVADTTHEASLTLLYTGKDAIGDFAPRLAVTRRTKGDGGIYTLVGIAPQIALSRRKDGPSLTLPVTAGIGWGGFYGSDSGDRGYGSAGVSIAQPLRIGGARASLQAEILAVVRDDRLRRLDAPAGTTAAVLPLATISMRMAW